MNTHFKTKLATSVLMAFVIGSAGTALAETKRINKKSSKAPASTAAPTTSSAPAAAVSATAKSVAPQKTLNNESISAAVFQPAKDASALSFTPNYSATSQSVKMSGATRATAYDSATTTLAAEYRKGMTSQTSAAIKMGLASTKQDNVPDSSGLTDIQFNLQSLKSLSQAQLFYGADLTYSPGERDYSYRYETATSKDSRTGNQFTGGAALKPYVGYQRDLGNAIAGVKATYENRFEASGNARTANGAVSYSTSGGNSLTIEAFRETMIKNRWVGGKIGFAMLQGSETQVRGNGTKSTFDTGSTDALMAGVYAQIPVKQMMLIPALNYGKTLRGTGGQASIEDLEMNELSLTARMPL